MANRAESILRFNNRWIAGSDLAAWLECSPRALRGMDSPIRHCAISGQDGYKHVKNASESEFKHWANRIRAHAIAELVHIRDMRRLRALEHQQNLEL